MIEGAAILAAGLVVGWLHGRFGGRRKKDDTPKPVKAICSCRHARGQHVDGKGACQATHEVDKYNALGGWIGIEHKQCTCQIYDGPEPVNGYYVPEITT